MITQPLLVTAYARSLGDKFTRLDRFEHDLNEATPGDPRDTTTPDAMLKTMQKIVTGRALTPASRDEITRWLIAKKTGDKKLRAGLPAGWRATRRAAAGMAATTTSACCGHPAGHRC